MAAPAPAIEQPASRANLALRPVQPADEAEPRWQPVLDLQCELTVDLAMPDFKIADLLKLRTGSVIDARLRRMSARAPKRLRLCESLPLGERRFVAVVEFESERFLLGGTASSLTLLSRLNSVGGEDGPAAGDETC
jgi:hypothetical protein